MNILKTATNYIIKHLIPEVQNSIEALNITKAEILVCEFRKWNHYIEYEILVDKHGIINDNFKIKIVSLIPNRDNYYPEPTIV